MIINAIEYIYCAVNSNNEIQWVIGSSKKTKYYATDKHVKKAVVWHNKHYPNDVWHVAKFELREVDYKDEDSPISWMSLPEVDNDKN